MMLHPAPVESAWFNSTATMGLDIKYHGKNAHAGAFPWEGQNALDALVLAHTAIGLLRQQIRPTDRIHGIITAGGLASNIIPDYAAATYGIRAARASQLDELKPRVTACFEAAALATGCRLELTAGSTGYADMRTNEAMALAYMANLESLGAHAVPAETARRTSAGGATDMGNVSYVVPSIHPTFAIPVTAGAANHTPGFTACAATEEAHAATIRAAKAMAMTALDLYARPDVLEAVRSEFRAKVDGR
jgi:metal-dependent amidase/aminoacylase/carboxypeptidase family protein